MREIKFRVWDVDLEEWMYMGLSSMLGIVDGHLRQFYSIPQGGIGNKEHTSQYVLMQYTGLKDKNGQEIYEGDVIQVFFDKSEQREEDKAYTVIIRDMMKDQFLGVGNGYGEVIGNIYENPELIKTQND